MIQLCDEDQKSTVRERKRLLGRLGRGAEGNPRFECEWMYGNGNTGKGLGGSGVRRRKERRIGLGVLRVHVRVKGRGVFGKSYDRQ